MKALATVLRKVTQTIWGGLAFALFYTTLGIPVARLADRVSRTGIMTCALALWSVMTAACGLTHSFMQLFLTRLGVGVSEAGGVAPAYSLICDYFPRGERARALSVYSFGIPIGSAAGIVAGGLITSLVSWRVAFIIVGLAGLFITPIFKLTVREPARGFYDNVTAAQLQPTFRQIFTVLLRKPSFWGLSLGAAASSMMGYGLFFWVPSFLVRSFGVGLLQASLGFGALILIGGIVGIWMGGVIADSFGQKHKERVRAGSLDCVCGDGSILRRRRALHYSVDEHCRDARADRTRTCMAGADSGGSAAHRAGQYALNRFRDLSIHQQPYWHRPRDDTDRCPIGRDACAFRR
jgi:MFS family permease